LDDYGYPFEIRTAHLRWWRGNHIALSKCNPRIQSIHWSTNRYNSCSAIFI